MAAKTKRKPKKLRTAFAKKLRSLLTRRKIPVVRAAERLGIRESTIYTWLSFRTPSKAKQTRAIELLKDFTAFKKLTTLDPKALEHPRPYDTVDWSLTNSEIAAKTGRTRSAVCNARKKLAPETERPRGWGTKQKHDWAAMDWSKRNVELAEAHGINVTSVSHARAFYAPETRKMPKRAKR